MSRIGQEDYNEIVAYIVKSNGISYAPVHDGQLGQPELVRPDNDVSQIAEVDRVPSQPFVLPFLHAANKQFPFNTGYTLSQPRSRFWLDGGQSKFVQSTPGWILISRSDGHRQCFSTAFSTGGLSSETSLLQLVIFVVKSDYKIDNCFPRHEC